MSGARHLKVTAAKPIEVGQVGHKAHLEQLIARSVQQVCVIHAPAGFGKSLLLESVHRCFKFSSRAAQRHSFRASGSVDAVQSFVSTPYSLEVLLLDDVDIAPANLFQELLTRVEEHSLPTRLVVTARSVSTIPVARLRAQGRVMMIGPDALRLTRRETVDVFGRRVGPAIQGLWDAAAGWPVAAELIAQWLEGGGQLNARAELLNATGLGQYIEQEVVASLSAEQRLALTHAGIFAACTCEMLNAIDSEAGLGRHLCDIAHVLDGLIEQTAGKYRLSPMLRLWANQIVERWPTLVRTRVLHSAADACAASGEVVEAVELIIRSGESGRVADYVRQAGGLRLWLVSGYGAIRALVQQVGPAGVAANPLLKVLKCLVLLKDGQIAEAERLLGEAIHDQPRDLATRRDAEVVRTTLLVYGCRPVTHEDLDAFRKTVVGRNGDHAWETLILTIQCVLNAQQAAFDAAVANALEAKLHAEAAGSKYNLMFLDIHLAGIALARGRLVEARGLLGRARSRWRAEFSDELGVETILSSLSAALEFEAGRLSAARVHVRKSVARLSRSEAWFDIYAAAYEVMARLIARDEGIGAALSVLDNARAVLSAQGLGRVSDLLEATAGCIAGEWWLRTGALPRTIPHPKESTSTSAWHEREAGDLYRAYHKLASGSPGEAVTILDELLAYSRSADLRRSELRALLLQVEALDRASLPNRADEAFTLALAIAGDTGQQQAFREFGGPGVANRIERLLSAIDRGHIVDQPITHLMMKLRRGLAAAPDPSLRPSLTKREQEVLAELDLGGSDKAIARRLGVSEHAVRFHLKSIFKKLRVTDRVEALHRARVSGVLH